MPHKHTRRDQDESAFDLPPTQFARPLPVKSNKQVQQDAKDGKQHKGKPKNAKGKDGSATPATAPAKDDQKKRKRKAKEFDDAPRAFKRLMAVASGRKIRSGLDDGDEPAAGSKKNKKNKKAQDQDGATKASSSVSQKAEVPTIRPGERMSEFAARVDAALPVTGLITKSVRGKADPLGAKKWQTNKERKMHKLYEEWREEDRKVKEKREEELELQDEEDLEDEDQVAARKLEMQANAGSGKSKKKKGSKRSRYLGEVSDPEDDPWEELRKKRGEKRPGLHDVALAPPELNKKLPKKLLVRGAAVEVDGVPKAAGSLRRREELQTVRDDVVAQYRKLMSDRRAQYEAKN
ncbi:hypothetical protein Micbo1qcDRAFT_161190 [Microdochium bolleyi]|uniref:Urease accessory protein UreD n=1 Tax=Microdochium bolleyi TaxID=196109 RepID=A0A136J7V1_9PEZI|nr:hypothetical protein Micbo1qcDRAFT_161190 [Microdochium bolleyi]